MAGKRKGDLLKVGEAVEGSLGGGFLGLARSMLRVFQVWEEAVGAFNAQRTRPESIKDGQLRVFVESPVWIDHYTYFKEDFITRVNQAAGAELVTGITFTVGPLERPAAAPETTAGASAPRPARPPDDPAIKEAVARVEDPALRASLAAFLARQKP